MTIRKNLSGIAAASLLACAAATDGARASTFVVNIDQVGSNVVVTGSGSVDLSGLSPVVTVSRGGFVFPRVSLLLVGPATSGSVDVYTGVTGPLSFGSGGQTIGSSGTGGLVGVSPGNSSMDLGVPHLYVSGDPLSDTMTFNGANFTSLGLTPGTYTFTWDTTDSFVINIVPLPAALPLFATGIGALGLLGWRRKRKEQAI